MCDKTKNTSPVNNGKEFVTVVSVGPITTSGLTPQISTKHLSVNKENYVTILELGDTTNADKESHVTEEVLIYRLLGERLGFGLKFEGGTQSEEFVKKLYIQSCAPESPASMAHCSWGKLVEGDEILQIDSLSVTKMTRIDCVRSLKDSSVVIKLLIKHVQNPRMCATDNNTGPSRSEIKETEQKRLPPPPPPPVPPRRIPRKLSKDYNRTKPLNEIPLVPDATKNVHSIGKLIKQQPEFSTFRHRQLSDDILVTPEAAVYLDVLSQEHGYYLSESDDTESSISTVIDRLASLPSTRPSSFAGSLPSTPTVEQKQLNLSAINYNDDFEMFTTDADFITNLSTNEKFQQENDVYLNDNLSINRNALFLEPQVHFYDAQLSYGNETVDCIETSNDTNIRLKEKHNSMAPNRLVEIKQKSCSLILPPTGEVFNSKLPILATSSPTVFSNNIDDLNLLRLIYAVPKTTIEDQLLDRTNMFTDIIKKVQKFLKNEVQFSTKQLVKCEEVLNSMFTCEPSMHEMCNSELNTYKLGLPPQLATIGEDDEESYPEIIRSIAVLSPESTKPLLTDKDNAKPVHEDLTARDLDVPCINLSFEKCDKKMLVEDFTPSTDNFPMEKTGNPPSTKFEESFVKIFQDTKTITPDKGRHGRSFWFKDAQANCSVQEKIAIFSNPSGNKTGCLAKIPYNHSHNSTNTFSTNDLKSTVPTIAARLSDIPSNNNLANGDRQCHGSLENVPNTNSESATHHALNTTLPRAKNKIVSNFSKSSLDIYNVETKTKQDRWSSLVEQRYKSLSKLKGLVIPNKVDAMDKPTVVDLPEIKSTDPLDIDKDCINKTLPVKFNSCNLISYHLDSVIPRYGSDLQFNKQCEELNNGQIDCDVSSSISNLELSNFSENRKNRDHIESESLAEPPRSLESIASPTQSNCSFEYNSTESNPEVSNGLRVIEHQFSLINEKDAEQESDNDSALSSSQSSDISRVSPSESPTGFQNGFITQTDDMKMSSRSDVYYNRLLKPYSEEAINRKNILASAKCRSGQDLKIGFSVIKTELKENSNLNNLPSKDLKMSKMIFVEEPRPSEVRSQRLTDSVKEDRVSTTTLKPVARRTYDKVFRVNNETILNKNNVKVARSASVTDLKQSFETLNSLTQVESKRISGINEKRLSLQISSSRTKESVINVDAPKPVPIPITNVNGLKKDIANNNSEVITLIPEIPGGSVGVTLAGGSDYENKEVTIYKIRSGSSAYRDGRLNKGDSVISINGRSVNGLSHAELVAALKEPLPEVTLAIAKGKSSIDHPPVRETPQTSKSAKPEDKTSIYVVPLLKDVTGPGFSLEGGQDSLNGNMPLLIKKVFKGGAAERSGNLYVGDQLIKVNDIDVSDMSRLEAWSMLRKITVGDVVMLTVKR